MLVSPLSLIDFSKAMFIRGGTQKQEVVGIPAAEAMALFLEDIPTAGCLAAQRVRRFLHMVLERRTGLLAGTAHALRRSFESLKEFDRREVLRTVTVLGILLEKLKGIIAHSSDREDDMESMAFQFGQLLAAVDVLHAGYCADVRKGDVPPALLGNQVFAIAQSSRSARSKFSDNDLLPTLRGRSGPHETVVALMASRTARTLKKRSAVGIFARRSDRLARFAPSQLT